MSRSDRFEQILALLGQQRYMSVEALCEKLFVSPSTLRRDLAQMRRSGYLVRTRGGAAAMTSAEENERIVHNQPLDFTPAQRAIAARAASFVRDGDVIFMDASRLSLCMAGFIRNRRPLTQQPAAHPRAAGGAAKHHLLQRHAERQQPLRHRPKHAVHRLVVQLRCGLLQLRGAIGRHEHLALTENLRAAYRRRASGRAQLSAVHAGQGRACRSRERTAGQPSDCRHHRFGPPSPCRRRR